ncbi:MAG: PAS domain S-box protein [Leptolyngbya sp. SIO3F4]|nr:PAS domain S-box protein [Leptolyngbya sp. SIO3F4]
MAENLDRYHKQIAELETANRLLKTQLIGVQKAHQKTIRDLEQVKQELHELKTQPSLETLYLVLDNMPEAAFWKDQNSIYLGCNKQFSKIAGLTSPEDVIGKNDFDLPWRPEEAEWFRKCDRRVMELGEPELGIIEPQHQADGQQYWLETNKIPLHDAQGNVVGILGTFMEITARIEAEKQSKQLNEELEQRVDARTQELQSSQARLQRLAANLPGLIFQFRLEANGSRSFPYISEGCRDIYELEPDDFLQCFDLVHERDRDSLEQTIQVSALTLSGFHHEHRIITPSGQLKWVQTIARPEQKTDEAILWDGLIIDISDRKQVEKEQQRLLSILEATPDIVGICDAQGNHLYLNQAGQRLLEIPKEKLRQVNIQACHPPETLKKIETEALPTAIQTGVWHGESCLLSQSGREFPVSQVILSHQDEDGNLEFLSSVMRDISDLKAAKQALYENEVKYQQILDSITDMVLVKRKKSYIVWANHAFRDYYGMSNDAINNLIDADFNNPDYTQQYIHDDAYVFTSGHSLEVEEPVTRHDGKVRQFNTIKSAIRNSQGEIILTVGVSRDITDRKQAEECLRQQEAQYRQIFETVTDGLGILNLETGNLVEANPAYCQMHGYSYQEILSLAPSAYVEQGSQHVYQDFIKAVQAGYIYIDQATNIHRDGSLIKLEIRGIPYLYQGKPHALCVLRDISERIQLEAERKQQEQALRSIVEGTATQTGKDFFRACVRHLASALNVRYALIAEVVQENNQQFAKTLAFWNGSDFGDNFQYALANNPCAKIVQTHTLCRYLSSVQAQFPKEDILAALNAESYVGIPVLNPNGDLLGFLSVVNTEPMEQDIGLQTFILEIFAARAGAEMERMQTEKALLASNKELEALITQLQKTQSQLVQSEKMSSLGQMVAGVAHEINNPVSFIHGNLAHAKNYTQDLMHLIDCYQQHYRETTPEVQSTIDDIELEFLKQDLPKLFQSMEVGTERIREIIKSLRMFSRLDESEIKQVNLHDGIDSTLTILQTRLRAQHWRPKIQVIKDYGNLPQIECYAGQLNQVFMNLLSNAVDAIEERDQQRTWQQMEGEPSTIQIHTQLLKDSTTPAVAISIADNGSGITKKAMEDLFNPFFTTKPVGKGTGLGLSISYQIITETHGGTITYNSEPGRGTTFSITLPIKQ